MALYGRQDIFGFAGRLNRSMHQAGRQHGQDMTGQSARAVDTCADLMFSISRYSISSTPSFQETSLAPLLSLISILLTTSPSPLDTSASTSVTRVLTPSPLPPPKPPNPRIRTKPPQQPYIPIPCIHRLKLAPKLLDRPSPRHRALDIPFKVLVCGREDDMLRRDAAVERGAGVGLGGWILGRDVVGFRGLCWWWWWKGMR